MAETSLAVGARLFPRRNAVHGPRRTGRARCAMRAGWRPRQVERRAAATPHSGRDITRP